MQFLEKYTKNIVLFLNKKNPTTQNNFHDISTHWKPKKVSYLIK